MKFLLLMGSVIGAGALSSCVEWSGDSSGYASTAFDSSESYCYSNSRNQRPPAPNVSNAPAVNCPPGQQAHGGGAHHTNHWVQHHGGSSSASSTGGAQADHPHQAHEQPQSGGWGLFGHRGNDNDSNAPGTSHHQQRHDASSQLVSAPDSTPNPPREREHRPEDRQPDPISSSPPSQPDPAPSAPSPAEPAPAEPAPAAPSPAPPQA